MFSQACVKNSVHRGGQAWQGGMCGEGGMHGGGGGVCGRGACMAGGRRALHDCPPAAYYEIRSMSGQYASYWNVFLVVF